ncbi:hypothetical protein [Rhodobium gokarnense]|uniref:IrrE N-terminal-like domain-containing protein n=1 Tax=Rhodobium gokarnense TaxID=364296 RepID=A0ABT3HEL8_9HYPH|nr:hypothetical protein [Rhodobium gokarnense]MCW2308842.1 hypothetical protein [Rhodobium gokarnense]
MIEAEPMDFDASRRRLRFAMDDALAQLAAVTADPLQSDIYLDVTADPEFGAMIERDGDRFRVCLTTGCVDTLDLLWTEALRDPDLLMVGDARITDDVAAVTHLSLVWLCLHELAHVRLLHFDLTGHSGLPETHGILQFALTGLAKREAAPVDALDPKDRTLAFPCMELQADSEAIDILLDAYDEDRWEELRLRAASIFAVMALIEREDRRHEEPGNTHPLSSTRFFVMLNHLFQMWLYPGAELKETDDGTMVIPEKEPTAEELQAYSRVVLGPAVKDAIALAVTAKARSFIADVGGDSPLIFDLETSQYGTDLSETDLKSAGGREWFRLLSVNEKLMSLTGLRRAPSRA